MKKTTSGFTIVELLIVIVVIAILAAIGVLAYTGIQNRANDSAIQSDLNNLAKKVHIVTAETGDFPPGGGSNPSSGVFIAGQHLFPGITFRVSKAAYDTSIQNLSYCTGIETASGQNVFHIRAKSKSGNVFSYSSIGGLSNLGNIGMTGTSACTGINYPRTWSYGYWNGDPPAWFSWTN